jgi:hypothetical protein
VKAHYTGLASDLHQGVRQHAFDRTVELALRQTSDDFVIR